VPIPSNEDRTPCVVFGTGTLGLAVTPRLLQAARPVRVVNRRGRADVPTGVEVLAADATDPVAARRACAGAAVVFHCASAGYGRWAKTLPPIMEGIIAGAAASGARLGVWRQPGPVRPRGPAPHQRPARAARRAQRNRPRPVVIRLMEAHANGAVATIGRASTSTGRMRAVRSSAKASFPPALSGKPARVLGDPDASHTYTFVDDFAEGLFTLATRDEALGQVWHVPSAERRALHQSEQPWIVDHSNYAQAFGAAPTPHRDAIGRPDLDVVSGERGFQMRPAGPRAEGAATSRGMRLTHAPSLGATARPASSRCSCPWRLSLGNQGWCRWR
jgi:hypothetical protein